MTKLYTDADVEIVAAALWSECGEPGPVTPTCREDARAALDALAAAGRLLPEGPAVGGGQCPSCGATYPRRIPVGEDQRCWTCVTADQTAGWQPEPTRCAAVAKDRRCHRRQGHEGRHRADEFPPLAWADGQPPERVGASRD